MESIQEAGEEAETPNVDTLFEKFFCEGMQTNRGLLGDGVFLFCFIFKMGNTNTIYLC